MRAAGFFHHEGRDTGLHEVGAANASNRSKGAGQLMIQNLLVAIVAGAGSALMFASVASQAFIALFLFYLAPLPLLMAALGWGPASALIGAALAAIAIGSQFGGAYLLAFCVIVAVPALWLGYLTLLARPATDNSEALVWYPPARLLVWVAVLAFVMIAAALLTLGSDDEVIHASLTDALTKIIGSSRTANGDDIKPLVDLLARIAPAATGIVAMLTLTLNLWLAGRIVLFSGRLRRPWPDLRAIMLPAGALFLLILAFALSLTGGMVAMFSQIAAAALAMAFAFAGLSAFHAISLRWQGRAVWLVTAYALLFIFGWPIIAFTVLGLIDTMFDLRARLAAPPSSSPQI